MLLPQLFVALILQGRALQLSSKEACELSALIYELSALISELKN